MWTFEALRSISCAAEAAPGSARKTKRAKGKRRRIPLQDRLPGRAWLSPERGSYCLQMVRMTLMALALALALASTAAASDRVALNATHVRIAVSKDGSRAMLTYAQGGKTRHAL